MTALAEAIRPAPARRNEIAPEERLIVALDLPTVDDACAIVRQLDGQVNFFKIGMQLQFAGGLDFAKELISQGKKVFLDSKLWDIEQTITSAVQNVAKMGVTFLTVHGERKAIEAAIRGRGSSPLKIFAVTFLTNLDEHDLKDLHFAGSVSDFVKFRAQLAINAGADGVITSTEEASQIRGMAGNKLTIVVPGIRPSGAPRNDQRRTGTPAQAIAAGADYLVVGRPIIQADDPSRAAQEIIQEIAAASRTSASPFH